MRLAIERIAGMGWIRGLLGPLLGPWALVAVLFGVAPLGSRASAQPASAAPPSGYQEGQGLLADKRYAEAVEKLRAVTSARPDFAPGWFALALAERRAGRCADAIPAYRRYAALQPADAEPYFGLGLCLRDTGDRTGAVVALRRFVELEHRTGQEKWLETARSLIAGLEPPVVVASPVVGTGTAPPPLTPQPPAAAPAPAPPSTPAKRNAAYEEAQRLRDEGKIDVALKTFAAAVEQDPDLIAARAAWGELLIKIHREGEAIGILRAAVERQPQYPLAWYELGFALRETGRFAEAVEAYRRYIALRPDDPDPHYGVARALQKLGREQEAARSFATYVAMEKRPGEERWVSSARAEIATLGRRGSSRPAESAAPAPAPSAAPGDRPAAPPR